MDELMVVLSDWEVELLYVIVWCFILCGVVIIYVLYWLKEIFDLCDCIMILKDGVLVFIDDIIVFIIDELVWWMVGCFI